MPNDVKGALRDDIKEAIRVAIDPGQNGRFPETERWIYVAITEAFGEVGAGLPSISIDTRPGRKREQKDHLVRLLCDIFEKHVGTRDVYTLFRTTDAMDHIGGDTPLPEWQAD
jgi:hypothetical protein